MLTVLLGLVLTLDPQAVPPPPAAALPAKPLPEAKSDFDIVLDGPGRVAYAFARDASRGDLAKRLQPMLKVPIRLSENLAKSRVTFARISRVPLSELLGRLAPVVQVDWHEPWGEEPTMLTIHLLDSTEPEPQVQEAAGLAIEGTVEDSPDDDDPKPSPGAKATPKAQPPKEEAAPPAEGPFLRVRRLGQGRISIEARDQGLGVLLFEAAQACGARFDLKVAEAPMVGRFSVEGILPSQLPSLLGLPGVGADIRRNIQTGEELALRFFVNPAS